MVGIADNTIATSIAADIDFSFRQKKQVVGVGRKCDALFSEISAHTK
ncbi:hypothetical protein BN938_1634 [Mucinivorans hirudinis]|uniref:Uncharacterized protein n=1 Tax=Mucinivorans hirudinis TaxID=1433126 RepID=A0A060RDD7_9BACT|nr:hypothetical protein BN938_1634 [Mucinivorans hirudinis]